MTLAEQLVLEAYAPAGGRPRSDTCRKGLHVYTPENTYTYPNGNRTCRACRRDGRPAHVLRNSRSSERFAYVWEREPDHRPQPSGMPFLRVPFDPDKVRARAGEGI